MKITYPPNSEIQEAVRLNKKARLNNMLPKEKCFKYKDINRLKIRV